MTIVTLGLDLGKNWVHVVGFDGNGRIVLRRRVRRSQVLALTANMPPCLIGMEACSGAHHLGRALQAQGHGGTADAAAICEALRQGEQERLPRCRGQC